MATFTTIADTVLEPGKPIRSVDTLALRDNPIAIAGGAAGAPRIVTNAIQDANVTAAKLASNSVTTVKIADANVNAAKLASNSVTTVKIADANVTTAKLATNERMTTANVLARTAGATAGAVGTYAFLRQVGGGRSANNSTRAGSGFRFSNARGDGQISSYQVLPTPSGTWRCMGFIIDATGAASTARPQETTVWLRIS